MTAPFFKCSLRGPISSGDSSHGLYLDPGFKFDERLFEGRAEH